MVQFAAPKTGEPPKKKKKELGLWMDIVQAVAPIAASVVGTPLAGAAVSALLEGTEAKLEGGSWKEALTKGALSGGIGAATGGLMSGAGGAASEAGKQLGKGVVEEAGKQALKETVSGVGKEGAKQFSLGLAADSAGELITDTAMNRAMASIGDEVVQQGAEEIAGSLAGAGAGAAVGETGAKQKFVEHLQNLGTMGAEMHMQAQAEGAQKRRVNEMLNQQLQQRVQGAMQGDYQRPRKSRFYTPYGYGGY